MFFYRSDALLLPSHRSTEWISHYWPTPGKTPCVGRCVHIMYHLCWPAWVSSWSTSWSGALHLIFHTFLHPISVFFRSTCPYHRNLFRCSVNIISCIPSLSLNSLLGTLSFTLTLHIYLSILISARWSDKLENYLWLWKKLENSEFFSPTLWSPCNNNNNNNNNDIPSCCKLYFLDQLHLRSLEH